jgi:V-type H+-transporting ATPase subunit F
MLRVVDDYALALQLDASHELFSHTQDTVTGFLLAGVGHRNARDSNFLVVKPETNKEAVEEAFKKFTSERDDIGIVLINQHVANDIRHVLKNYTATIPTVLEIPSKEHPYDPEQDYIMQRVNMFLGGGGI